MIRWIVLALASAGFIGYIPYRIVPMKEWKGAGLLGSIAGWGLYWLLPEGGALYWTILTAVILLSIPIGHYAEKWLSHDDPRIVIDEVAGVWVACIGLPREVWPAMLLGLIFFRVFDVFKGPWGHWAAKAPGGLGVVADDLLAGLIANLLARLCLFLPLYF